jgi:hypothetical protein
MSTAFAPSFGRRDGQARSAPHHDRADVASGVISAAEGVRMSDRPCDDEAHCRRSNESWLRNQPVRREHLNENDRPDVLADDVDQRRHALQTLAGCAAETIGEAPCNVA